MSGRHYVKPTNRKAIVKDWCVESITLFPHLTILFCLKWGRHITGIVAVHLVALVILESVTGSGH